MQETRRARLASVIRDELSVLLREIKDPRVGLVTITNVEVTPDGGQATIFVTPFGKVGDESHSAKPMLQGLESASGFLRRSLTKSLTVRTIPTLVFKEDKGFANTLRVNELLKQITDSDR